jgi:hypothetical protein
MYFISIPFLAYVGALSSGTVYENIIKRTPSFSKALKMKILRRKVSSGKLSVLIRLDWSPLPIRIQFFSLF